MPLQIVNASSAGGTSPRIASNNANADYTISTNVLIAVDMAAVPSFEELGATAVRLTASQHDLTVHGTVMGMTAVQMGDDAGLDYGHALIVGATGSLLGNHAGAVLRGAGTVTNDGEIRGVSLHGLVQTLETTAAATIVNRGVISGGSWAVSVVGGVDTTVALNNDGRIQGALLSYHGVNGRDAVTNTGVMAGDVYLGAGHDLFQNIGGQVLGRVFGEGGNDTFVPGGRAETFVGGEGNDTLDFRSGGSLTVDLRGGPGTGRPKGDSYQGIERVLGSATGDDWLIGSAAANTLAGGRGRDRLWGEGGADRIEGGEGRDWLRGGEGVDTLFGGQGNDVFVLRPKAQDRDVIQDFGGTAGDDGFLIEVTRFGAGLGSGEALGSRFVSRADSNEALGAEDRFVFRESDATLWWDKDGAGGAAGVMVADLQAGAVVTAGDFLLA